MLFTVKTCVYQTQPLLILLFSLFGIYTMIEENIVYLFNLHGSMLTILKLRVSVLGAYKIVD